MLSPCHLFADAPVLFRPHSLPASLFRPELYWWRMILTLRKFCEVAVALMFSSSPLFQAWYAHDCPHSTKACVQCTLRSRQAVVVGRGLGGGGG
jgi:hypothetical protein